MSLWAHHTACFLLFLLSTNHFTPQITILNSKCRNWNISDNRKWLAILLLLEYTSRSLSNDLDFISGQNLKIINIMKFLQQFNHKFINVFKRLHRCPLLLNKVCIVLRLNLNCASNLWSISSEIVRPLCLMKRDPFRSEFLVFASFSKMFTLVFLC